MDDPWDGPPAQASDAARAARIAALRAAWLAGSLDLSIDVHDPGLDRLLAAHGRALVRGVHRRQGCILPDPGSR